MATTIGIDLVTLALLGSDGKIDMTETGLSTTGLFEIVDEVLGTNTANVTNMEGAVTPVYGNNGTVDSSAAKGDTSVAFTFNDLPFEISNKILGMVADKNGGFAPSQRKPKVAVLIKTHSLRTGNDVYTAFGQGKFTSTAENHQTNTNTEQRTTDQYTYTALDNPAWKQQYKKFYADADNFDFDAMMADVFPGYQAAGTGSGTGGSSSGE